MAGQPPLDPKSNVLDAQTEAAPRFRKNQKATAALATRLILADIHIATYAIGFYPGGHGPMWDLVNDKHSVAIIEEALAAEKPIALVCHAPAVLKNARALDGSPLVKSRVVSGFPNSEEKAVGLTEVVPLLVEGMLKPNGGHYRNGPDFKPYAVDDGLLITG